MAVSKSVSMKATESFIFFGEAIMNVSLKPQQTLWSEIVNQNIWNIFTGEHFTTAICGTVHNKDLLQHDIQMHT